MVILLIIILIASLLSLSLSLVSLVLTLRYLDKIKTIIENNKKFSKKRDVVLQTISENTGKLKLIDISPVSKSN